MNSGQEARISAKVDTRGHSGLMLKGIKVLTNDPQVPAIMLFMRANIEKDKKD